MALLFFTLFRCGFLGLILIARASISHIVSPSSESEATRIRLNGDTGAAVLELIDKPMTPLTPGQGRLGWRETPIPMCVRDP